MSKESRNSIACIKLFEEFSQNGVVLFLRRRSLDWGRLGLFNRFFILEFELHIYLFLFKKI
jgi:hypothetical protein